MGRLVLCVAFMLLTVSASRTALAQSGPNFDCNMAAKPAEKFVCASAALSSVDVELAETYKKAMAAPGVDREALQHDQKRWLGLEWCGNWGEQRVKTQGQEIEGCLQFLYRNRIRILEMVARSTYATKPDKRPCEGLTKATSLVGDPRSGKKNIDLTFADIESTDPKFERAAGFEKVETKPFLAQQGLEDRGYRLGPISLDPYVTPIWVHLSRQTKPDLVLEAQGGTDFCHWFNFFVRDANGDLVAVEQVFHDFCEALDVGLTFVRYDKKDFAVGIIGKTAGPEYWFLEFDRIGRPVVVCHAQPYVKGSPIDFDPNFPYFRGTKRK